MRTGHHHSDLSRRAPPARRILTVELDSEMQRLLTALLSDPGTLIECVTRADIALRLLHACPTAYNCVILEDVGTGIPPVVFIEQARSNGFIGRIIKLSSAGIIAAPAPAPNSPGADLVLLSHPIDFRALRHLLCPLPA